MQINPSSAVLLDRTAATITPDEMAYHRELVEKVKWAQDAQAQITAIDGAFRSWAEHLHAKYELAPGDGVDENGIITRAPTADSLDVAGR